MRFSSKDLGVFYYQLGTLVRAGLPIQRAIGSVQQTAPRPMRSTVAALAAAVDAGAPLHEAMERCGRRFAHLDRHSIDITERSGALDVGLLSLSKYHETRAAARSKLIAGSIYPLILLTAGVFIPLLPGLILGRMTMVEYLWATAGRLGAIVLICWVVSLLLRWSFQVPKLNLMMDRALITVPLFGRLRFDYALSQWIMNIRLLLTAGIGIVPALETASRMVYSPLVADAYRRAAPLIGSQLDVSQALASTGVFPHHLIQLWATGEQSGRMDEMLDRLAQFYEERWRNSLDQVVTWMPRIAYGLVMIYIVSQIFSALGSYINTIDSLLNE